MFVLIRPPAFIATGFDAPLHEEPVSVVFRVQEGSAADEHRYAARLGAIEQVHAPPPTLECSNLPVARQTAGRLVVPGLLPPSKLTLDNKVTRGQELYRHRRHRLSGGDIRAARIVRDAQTRADHDTRGAERARAGGRA